MTVQRHSEGLDKLIPALVSAQGEFPPIPKDGYNPHFKSRFSTLGAVKSATGPVLSKHGLAVMQFPSTTSDGKPSLTTWLAHESGQWIADETVLEMVKHDPQAQGSAITYLRRYALTAVLGLVADEDDDGNSASLPAPAQRQAPQQSPAQREMMRLVDAAKRAGKAKEAVEEMFSSRFGKPMSAGSADELGAVADALTEQAVQLELAK